jgi:acetolactate synthase-1/2/3 large subunit
MLVNAGVRHVFGIVSIHNMPIVDAISRTDDIEFITTRHEQSAAHMADGYARATGSMGVACGSTGPGTTNMMTGLYEASYSSSRLLVITGQTETSFYGKGKGYVHEAEQQKPMLQSVARAVASPRYIHEIGPMLKTVIDSIHTGRPQPGAIEVPIDLQYAESSEAPPTLTMPKAMAPDPDTLTHAISYIRKAKKRAILVGGGISTMEAKNALTQFAENIDAPVLTTLNGKGSIRSDHPLHMGSSLMHPPLREVLNDADVLIAIATRFQAGTGGIKVKIQLPPLVHIDIDPRNINLNFSSVVGLVSDAELALRNLIEADIPKGDAEFRQSMQSVAHGARTLFRERIGPDHARVLDTFTKYMGEDVIFVRDSTIPGYNWGNGLLPIDHPRGYIFPTSGAIGPGLPLGMGVAMATNQKTIVMHGDGGLMLHIGELATAAQYQIPIVIVVFNDGGYGILRGLQARRFDGRFSGTELHTPDFVMLAKSMGVTGLYADNAEELEGQLETAMSMNGPVLVELNAHNMEPIQGVVRAPNR